MSKRIHTTRRLLARGMLCTGIMSGLLVLVSMNQASGGQNGAWVVEKKLESVPWKVISPEEIEKGASIPPDTNVVFHLPSSFERITRDVLFGAKSDQFRYWGYCIPENYDPAIVAHRTGFPGQLFLSEAERAYRKDLEDRHKPQFTIFRLPSRQDVNSVSTPKTSGIIRHQLDVFTPNLVCFVMSSVAISIGIDPDADGLNNKLESDAQTDPTVPDTDADGLSDGIEVAFGTDPLLRDTDSDNLLDGLEDRNANGRLDWGEPDPRDRDSDKDLLCDGSCRTIIGRNQVIFYGEDNNLNGVLDVHETSTVLRDTNGDGVTDYQAFFNCMVGVTEYCL